MPSDLGNYRIEISEYLVIRKTNYSQTQLFDHFLSVQIICLCLLCLMHGSIQLDNKFCRRTIKIDDKDAYTRLTTKLESQRRAFQTNPEQNFGISHVIP